MAGRGNVLTGARAALSLDGVKCMYTLSATYGEEIQHDPVEPLDQFDVAEFVPIAYRVNFSAQWVRVIRNSIKLRASCQPPRSSPPCPPAPARQAPLRTGSSKR